MKTENFNENRSNIIISLLIGIVLFYMQPFLKLIGDTIINFLINISGGFSSFYFRNVALYNFNSINWISVYILIIMLAFIFIFGIQYYADTTDKLLSRIEKTIKEILNKEKPEEKTYTAEETERFIKETKLKIETHRKNRKKVLRYSIIVASITIVLLYCILAFSISLETKNRVFTYRTTILKPIVGEQKIDSLKAQWVQITNKTDFDNINNKISLLLSKNK